MTLRHHTGRAEIVTLINRFGHCISYSSLIELETAKCKRFDENDSVIPSTVLTERNIFTQPCWDNFNMREETQSRQGIIVVLHFTFLLQE